MESVDTLSPNADESAAAPSRIRVLPAALADQIAAGEVVERPASVVKELVENALDAGARVIDITLEGGGRKLVRVVDDGGGMTPVEARLALLRHATSKLNHPDDLWALGTFGFRGEALPSIAAVSRFVLSTKTSESAAGFRLEIEAGREVAARVAGLPQGTQIEVSDLFFNVPARLKFLKIEATETANASEAVLRLALANEAVHFRMRQAGRTILDLPPARDRGARARAALARRGAESLHEIVGDENGVKVHAFVGPPEEATGTARNTFLFVGRRFVRDRSLLSALSMGYGELLEKGRYPVAALFLEVPGDELDINVHPQKLEVRFARAQEVYGAVRHVVAAAIARAPWLARDTLRTCSLPPPAPDQGLDPRGGEHNSAQPQRPSLPFPSRNVSRSSYSSPAGSTAPGGVDSRRVDLELWTPPAASPLPVASNARDAEAEQPIIARPDGFFCNLDYIGQFDRTYLLCGARNELVLVDQHAAHERVAFQRLREAHRNRQVPRQQLLFPMRLPVDETQAALVRDGQQAELLLGFGFEIEAFGPQELLVRAVPQSLRDADPKPVLMELLADLADGGVGRSAEEKHDHILATLACHSVVRAGDLLLPEQARALLADLDGVDLRTHCPHGRPVLLRLPLSEIERRFGRT